MKFQGCPPTETENLVLTCHTTLPSTPSHINGSHYTNVRWDWQVFSLDSFKISTTWQLFGQCWHTVPIDFLADMFSLLVSGVLPCRCVPRWPSLPVYPDVCLLRLRLCAFVVKHKARQNAPSTVYPLFFVGPLMVHPTSAKARRGLRVY